MNDDYSAGNTSGDEMLNLVRWFLIYWKKYNFKNNNDHVVSMFKVTLTARNATYLMFYIDFILKYNVMVYKNSSSFVYGNIWDVTSTDFFICKIVEVYMYILI